VENQVARGVQLGWTTIGRFLLFILSLPLAVSGIAFVLRAWFRGEPLLGESAMGQWSELFTRYFRNLFLMVIAAILYFFVSKFAPG
jgi:hypothetical protein